MLIFLYGQDTYRLSQKLREIIEEYKKIHQSGLNLRFLDFSGSAGELSFKDFKDVFQQRSIFKEKRLIVLTDVFSNKDLKQSFLKNIKNLVDSKDVIVISEKNKILDSNPLFKILKKKATSQEFKPLEGQDLKNWVKKEIERYRVKIEPEALQQIIDFIGNDLWRFSNEIKKLVNYKGKNSNLIITKQDIELLVRPKIEPDIFQTINFLASKNKKQALNLLKKHLEKGDNPLYLLSMISFQFRNLLMIRELIDKNRPYFLISKETKLHPYVVKKSHAQAQRFSLSELKKIYQKIFEVDLNIKTGKLEPETALELLIAEI